MHPRASQLIEQLGLQPHPEGGHFREIHRSTQKVQADAGERSGLTTIFFLLTEGDCSRWHRVTSDEAWHHYEGAPLELLMADAALEHSERRVLGPVAEEGSPVHVVPAGWWQAARSTGDYTLVGCSVGPGFSFDDFTMLSDLPELAQRMRTVFPDHTPFV